MYKNYCECKYFLAGHKDIIFEGGLCEWNGADDLFEKFCQNELWMQGSGSPHGGESRACLCASDREEGTSAKCFSILGS